MVGSNEERVLSRTIPSFLTALCLALPAAAGVLYAQEEPIEAISRPSEDVTLAFTRPGRVAEVLVKEGDEVKKGQLLVKLDDEAERVRLAELKAKAEDDVRIRAAQAQLDQKTVDYKKLEEAFEKRAVSRWDVEHARLEVKIAELSLELARFEHGQDKGKYEEAKIELARMRLVSPIDGIVETILIERGESADALEDVVRVVKVDPLWIDVPVAVTLARTLKWGQSASLTFPDAVTPVEGKVIHIAAVADAASLTLNLRAEVANKEGRPAGEHVVVKLHPPNNDK
jgi:macrolide-specific efflux system membrane fusion protein